MGSDVMRLRRRIALVTGAGRGIGRATALELARHGAMVAAVARTAAEIEEVAADITRRGERAIAVQANLAEREAMDRALAEIAERLGPVDILINNAAAIGPFGLTAETDSSDWEHVLTVNLVVPYRLCRAVLPGMVAAGWGRIVNVSSLSARVPTARFGAYSPSKAGLEMLTRQLALELEGSGVAVAAVNPGAMATSMNEAIRTTEPALVGSEVSERFRAAHAEGRLRNPIDVGPLIAAMVGKGDQITGQIIDAGSDAARHLVGP